MDRNDQDLQPLRDWLLACPAPDPAVTRYHDARESVTQDGTRCFTSGWYEYGPEIHSFWQALAAAGWDYGETQDYLAVVARWQVAQGKEALGADKLSGMDRHTLFNALRWYDRGERFCDGVWASAWEQGVFHSGAKAVLALGRQ